MPTLGVNDEYATLTWEVANGAPVHKGQAVAQAETTKATFEIHAEAAGYLYYGAAGGEQVHTGAPIAVIHPREGVSESEIQAILHPPAAAAPAAAPKKWTQKALLLAQSKNIAIEDVPGTGDAIREADVLAFLEKPSQPAAAPALIRDTVDDAYRNRRTRVLILGGGRGAVQVLDVVQRLRDLRPAGIVDDNPALAGKTVMGVPVVGTLSAVRKLWEEQAFDKLVMSMSNAREYRRQVFDEFRSLGMTFANVIDPSVSIHSNVQMGQGNLIMAHCRIGSCAILGDNNFLSAFINLEHHNILGDHCTFGPGISTSSRVTIGSFVKFGTGIFIEPGVTIGDNCIVASGAVLVGPVPPNSIVRTRANYSIAPLGAGRK
jgi:sugar O-acyltransferase (sialic acid O-acetyltransferase NeuD family)